VKRRVFGLRCNEKAYHRSFNFPMSCGAGEII
jgi:hypothetical protein